jgi:excisionase family DNA binding protein
VSSAVNTTLSLNEVAKRLNVHYMTVYRYVRSGRLAARQQDGEWQVLTSDVRAFAATRTAAKRSPGSKRVVRAKRGARAAADWARRFETCLLAGDEVGAEQLLDDALNSGHDLFSLYLDVVSPALVAIGARWAAGNLHIHEEHRASTIVARLFARVSARFAHRGPSRGTIVIGGPSGERHGLALTMVADLLRSRGWNVSDIGPDMPAESFATAVQNIDQLRAVCVGVTLRESLPAAKSVIAAVNRVVPNDVTIYVGGAAVTSDADARQLGADTWAKDPRTLVALLSQAD